MPLPVQPPTEQVINEVFGGRQVHDIAANSTTVRACRLKVKLDSPSNENSEYDYEAGPFLTLSAEQASRFLGILRSPNRYEFGMRKGCIPIYGVKLRCESQDGSVDVDLCFSCDILAVRHQGKYEGGGNFDPMRHELVQLCKELFPQDNEIQKLELHN